MVGLFVFEFVEGNTVTRLYFMRLRRLTKLALPAGRFTPELEQARAESMPTFTHFLDLPIFFVIIALGALKPQRWTLFAVGCLLSLASATALTIYVPKLYPWRSEKGGS
jgi:hypothetical protein